MFGYFDGWYFKCESNTQTFAVIPAYHETQREGSCSIQIITKDGAWNIPYSKEAYKKGKDFIQIDDNYFGRKGLRLHIKTEDVCAIGRIEFGEISPLRYDIMGPFVLVPFMECRHSIYSMRYAICGNMCINHKQYDFSNGLGYWEGDRGKSFPKRYAWTQCMLPHGSVVLSVADIPLAGTQFIGMIGVVLWKGQEHRFATYLGGRVIFNQDGWLSVRQGRMTLDAKQIEKSHHPLNAPVTGEMVRTIHESLRAKAYYRFTIDETIVFAYKVENASFEYEY